MSVPIPGQYYLYLSSAFVPTIPGWPDDGMSWLCSRICGLRVSGITSKLSSSVLRSSIAHCPPGNYFSINAIYFRNRILQEYVSFWRRVWLCNKGRSFIFEFSDCCLMIPAASFPHTEFTVTLFVLTICTIGPQCAWIYKRLYGICSWTVTWLLCDFSSWDTYS